MGVAAIFIFAIVVSVSKALIYDPLPLGNGNTEDDYNDGDNGYIGNGVFQTDELNKVDKEKLLSIVSALLQQGNNPYNPFTDLLTFKGNKGKNRVSWRKWLNWSKSNANLGI